MLWFPGPKYKYIFQINIHTEAILSNNTWKLLWFEVSKMLIACIALFIEIFSHVRSLLLALHNVSGSYDVLVLVLVLLEDNG